MIESILIVDDEEPILETVEAVFEQFGWEVSTAKNAEEALIEFKKNSPTLVLTDLRLRDNVGGVGVCLAIKEISPLTLVVGMTGFGSAAYTIANLRRKGFDHVMKKPMPIAALQTLAFVAVKCRTEWNAFELFA